MKSYFAKEIRKGDSIGYSRAFVADRDSLTAIWLIAMQTGIRENFPTKRVMCSSMGIKNLLWGKFI